DLRHRPFVLFLKAAGQDDVCVPRCVVQEEVDRDVELQLLERTRDERVIRQRNLGIETDRQQSFDFAGVDLAKQLVGIDARAGQIFLVDTPDLSDVTPMFGVADVAPTRKLIALLPMLASALAVGLAGDRAVSALGFSDASRGEHEIDRPERVLYP